MWLFQTLPCRMDAFCREGHKLKHVPIANICSSYKVFQSSYKKRSYLAVDFMRHTLDVELAFRAFLVQSERGSLKDNWSQHIWQHNLTESKIVYVDSSEDWGKEPQRRESLCQGSLAEVVISGIFINLIERPTKLLYMKNNTNKTHTFTFIIDWCLYIIPLRESTPTHSNLKNWTSDHQNLLKNC